MKIPNAYMLYIAILLMCFNSISLESLNPFDSEVEIIRDKIDSSIINDNYIETEILLDGLTEVIDTEDEYIFFSAYYLFQIEVLNRLGKYDKIIEVCTEWEKDRVKFDQHNSNDKNRIIIQICLSYAYLNDIDLKKGKDLYQLVYDELQNIKDVFYNIELFDQFVFGYIIEIENMLSISNKTDMVHNNFDFFSLHLRKAKEMAREDIDSAIDYLLMKQEALLSEGYNSKYFYLIDFQSSNLFLSYLYYKSDDLEQSIHLFLKAISRDNYSTYSNNLDEWLQYRCINDNEKVIIKKIAELTNSSIKN